MADKPYQSLHTMCGVLNKQDAAHFLFALYKLVFNNLAQTGEFYSIH